MAQAVRADGAGATRAATVGGGEAGAGLGAMAVGVVAEADLRGAVVLDLDHEFIGERARSEQVAHRRPVGAVGGRAERHLGQGAGRVLLQRQSCRQVGVERLGVGNRVLREVRREARRREHRRGMVAAVAAGVGGHQPEGGFGHRAEVFVGNRLAVVGQDDIAAGDRDDGQEGGAEFGVGLGRDAQRKGQRIGRVPVDPGDRVAGHRVGQRRAAVERLDPGQAHRLAVARVSIGGPAGAGADDFLEDQSLSDTQVGEMSGQCRRRRTFRQAAALVGPGIERHLVVGDEQCAQVVQGLVHGGRLGETSGVVRNGDPGVGQQRGQRCAAWHDRRVGRQQRREVGADRKVDMDPGIAALGDEVVHQPYQPAQRDARAGAVEETFVMGGVLRPGQLVADEGQHLQHRHHRVGGVAFGPVRGKQRHPVAHHRQQQFVVLGKVVDFRRRLARVGAVADRLAVERRRAFGLEVEFGGRQHRVEVDRRARVEIGPHEAQDVGREVAVAVELHHHDIGLRPETHRHRLHPDVADPLAAVDAEVVRREHQRAGVVQQVDVQDALAQVVRGSVVVHHLDKVDAVQRSAADRGSAEVVAAEVDHGAARSKLSVRVSPVSRIS